MDYMRTLAERTANLVPRVRFNLRELKFIVVWIHAPYFFSCWCSQYLKYTIKAQIQEKRGDIMQL